jgi:hypothetical protein
MLTHLVVYRTKILREVGGFRLGTEGSQDYDVALRIIEKIPEGNIRHIPRILYHWRAIPGSVALSGSEKPYAHERARQVIGEHLRRKGIDAEIVKANSNIHRVIYKVPENTLTSLILFDHEFPEIKEILETAAGENFELIAMGSSCENIPGIKFIGKEVTLAASLNRTIREAKGEVLIFLDRKVRPAGKGWLRELASHALRNQIGVAGGKILNPDKTVRNAGIVFGVGPTKLGFAHRGISAAAWGYFFRAAVINNFSAVCGAFAVRRENLGAGFDADNFPNGLFEVDLCLRLMEKGYRNVFTPYAEFIQTAESPTEKILKDNLPELQRFKDKWSEVLKKDPFYNPNLSLAGENFMFELREQIKHDEI